MGAPKGNKFAEKWSKKEALALANQAFDIVSDECFYLSEVAEACGTYRDFFTYILDKFADDEDVFRTIKRMQNKCEAIIARKTGLGDIDKALGIFILKAYHRLTETQNINIGQNDEAKPLTVNINGTSIDL